MRENLFSRVAFDTMRGICISTIAIPDKLGFCYETMILGGTVRDGEQFLYRTRDEAIKGHAAAVTLVTGDFA